MFGIVTRLCTTAPGRNHDTFAHLVQRIDEPFLGVTSLICRQLRWRLSEEKYQEWRLRLL
jgi:hypothetical protein